jgi:hypothetical protein
MLSASCLRQHHTDATGRRSARGFRQGDDRHSRERSIRIESDCSVRLGLTLAAQDGQAGDLSTMTTRGFLVSGGKEISKGCREILAFQTDPGAMVAACFTSDGR